MPNTRTAKAVRLEFAPGALVQTNLSGAAFTGDWLWVAGDEACGKGVPNWVELRHWGADAPPGDCLTE